MFHFYKSIYIYICMYRHMELANITKRTSYIPCAS